MQQQAFQVHTHLTEAETRFRSTFRLSFRSTLLRAAPVSLL